MPPNLIVFITLLTHTSALEVYSGWYHNCAVFENNNVKCWGSNVFGQLGNPAPLETIGEGQAEMGANLPLTALGSASENASTIDLSLDISSTCAIIDKRYVKCFGHNNGGKLGYEDTDDRNYFSGPAAGLGDDLPFIDFGTNLSIVQLASSTNHRCALFENGKAKCWGQNTHGELGYGDTNNRGDEPGEMGTNLSFIDIGDEFNIIKVVVGSRHTCVLLNNSMVKCFGEGINGQLGTGIPISTNNIGDEAFEMGNNLSFTPLGENETVEDIVTCELHTCVLLVSNRVKCFGSGVDGQLGYGDNLTRGTTLSSMGDDLPYVDLGSTMKITSLTCGTKHTCAIFEDGKLKCWGSNTYGQLGQGISEDILGSKPFEMGTNLSFVDLGISQNASYATAGERHTCVRTVKHNVKCFGLSDVLGLEIGSGIVIGDENFEMGNNLTILNLTPDVLPTSYPTPVSITESPSTQAPSISPTPQNPTMAPTQYPTSSPTFPKELGVCEATVEDIQYSGQDSLNGDFEGHRALTQSLLFQTEIGILPLIGCVCRPGIEYEINVTTSSLLLEFFNSNPDSGGAFIPYFNDTYCIDSCKSQEGIIEILPESSAYMTSVSTLSLGIIDELAIALTSESINKERPNLKFNLYPNYEIRSYTFGFGTAKLSIEYKLQLIDPLKLSDNVFDLVDGSDDSTIFDSGTIALPDCRSGPTNWSSFKIPLKEMFRSRAFQNNQDSTKERIVLLKMSLARKGEALNQNGFLALDNLELIGPPLNDSENLLKQFDSVNALPQFEFNLLGQTPLNIAFNLIAYLFLGITLFLLFALYFGVSWFSTKRKLVSRYVILWIYISIIVSIYAISEFLDFQNILRNLQNEVEQQIQVLKDALDDPGFDSRLLEEVVPNNSLGVIRLVLPPLNISQLETIFVFQENNVEACESNALSDSTCVDTVREFEQAYESARANYTNSIFIEGTVTPSQSHFLVALLVGLISDLVVGFVLAATRLAGYKEKFGKKCGTKWKSSGIQQTLEIGLTMLNGIGAIVVLVIALTTPVLYDLNLNIYTFPTDTSIAVDVKSEFLTQGFDGSLVVDSSDIGSYQECFPPLDVNFTAESTDEETFIKILNSFLGNPALVRAFNLNVQSHLEVFRPERSNTKYETCETEDPFWYYDSDLLCVEIDCSDGVVPFVSSESVEPLLSFVFAQVIVNVVFIDLILSATDLGVLTIEYYFLPKLEKHTIDAKVDVKNF